MSEDADAEFDEFDEFEAWRRDIRWRVVKRRLDMAAVAFVVAAFVVVRGCGW